MELKNGDIIVFYPCYFEKMYLLKLAYSLFSIVSISRIVLTHFSAAQIRKSNTIGSSLISKKGFLYSHIFSVRFETSFWKALLLTYFHHAVGNLVQDKYHVKRHFQVQSRLWGMSGFEMIYSLSPFGSLVRRIMLSFTLNFAFSCG